VKILIIADIDGWIVNRIIDRMISGIDFDFTKRYYTSITPDQLVEEANKHDLVYYGNWCEEKHIAVLDKIKVPFLMGVRSHRYPLYVKGLIGKVHIHVISPALHIEFPGSYYIPDGIFDQFVPEHEFTVGFAGRPDDYKGFHLIEQACKELEVKFKPATGDLDPKDMYDYYKSIDLLVSASIAEGFCAPVMECLAMNIPVITTDTGIAKHLHVHKISRNVEDIKSNIQRFNTSAQVLPKYSWDNVCKQFKELFVNLKDKPCIRSSM
jgi:hypothetical protein